MSAGGGAERLLSLLREKNEWVRGAELGAMLGVSDRSVRTYVSQLNRGFASPRVLASDQGYRLDRVADADAEHELAAHAGGGKVTDRDGRILGIAQSLLLGDPLDLHERASKEHVSEVTIERDLQTLRARWRESSLELVRHADIVSVRGDEPAIRRALAEVVRRRHGSALVALRSDERVLSDVEERDGFVTALSQALDTNGYLINELALPDVLLELFIAFSRVRQGKERQSARRTDVGTEVTFLSDVVGRLCLRWFQLQLPPAEVTDAAIKLRTQVATPRRAINRGAFPAGHVEAVHRIVEEAERHYSVSLANADFLERLTSHLANVRQRSADHTHQANPLTKSMKAGYPLVYDLAVYLARGVQHAFQIELDEDEIAYLSLHVGTVLETGQSQDLVVTCTLACPNYYGMHEVLRTRLEEAIGTSLRITTVVSGSGIDWESAETDLIISTVSPSRFRDRIVVVQPFLSDQDVERVRAMIRRLRAQRVGALAARRLNTYMLPELFVRNPPDIQSAREAIQTLSGRMLDAGIVGASHVDEVLEREALSSTEFSPGVAVPHAMSLNASRTAIAFMFCDDPIDWNGSSVNVVALVAFAREDREVFQDVFAQLVTVFSEPGLVHTLLNRVYDFASLLDVLVERIRHSTEP